MIRILLLCLFSLLSSPGLLFAREVVFYHTDNVGTPVAMTNSTGAVVWRAHDKPFGEEFQTTATPYNSRRFIGKEKDKETGLVYIGARYLDPASGRFLQPDPVGPVDPMTGKVNVEMLANPQRLNRYAYGLNNPYRYIDPAGRDAILVKYIGYQVNTGFGFKLPLGHSAVIAVNPETGVTKYYEYGRYGSKFGKVNNPSGAPSLEIKEGKPTEKSLNNLYNYVSNHYGQGKPVEATYYNDADFQKTDDFATERMNDKNRQPYNLRNNNCKTFANETIQEGRKKE